MKRNSIAFYSGSGIGLLIGVLMGLAVSPTVGVIIGALASILAVLLGLNDTQFSDAKAVRIGSFGFACVLGAFLGIFVRSHNLLSPSPRDLLETYVEVGFSEQQARDFIAFKEFGILDKSWKMADVRVVTGTEASGEQGSAAGGTTTRSLAQSSHASVLFSADVDLSSCQNLEDLGGLPAEEIVTNFKTEEGAWADMAALAERNLEAGFSKPFLLAVRDDVCDQSTGKIDNSACSALGNYSRDVDYAVIREGFAARPGVWRALGASIEKIGMDDSSKARALWIINTSLCKPADKTKKG